MTAPKSTVWALDRHTSAKHEILRRYLEAWSAILSLGRFPAITYVDGFAGPGVYDQGEEGSPIIALNAALAQQGKHPEMNKTTLYFLFIEQKQDRADKLQETINALQLPANFHVKVVGGTTFEAGFREHHLDWYRTRNRPLPPTFAFIDPFGWTGVPFSLVKEILGNESCEVLFNFMYEEINRFIEHPNQSKNFDDLFGTAAWRDVSNIEDPRARRAFFLDLYVRQLRQDANAHYVRSFEMRNRNDATDYFLFFATNSAKGIKKMKEAMWKVDESGAFRFSDATAGAAQLALPFTAAPDFAPLRRAIVDRFTGTTATVGEIEDFVLADTPFRETHYKKQVLAPLEGEGAIVVVDAKQGRRAGTYPEPSMKLRFVNAPPALDVRQVRGALLAEPIEDGVSHASESVVAEFARAHGAPAMIYALNQLATQNAGPEFLRILARSALLDTDTRADLLRTALASEHVELRDAGIQAAESWNDAALADILREHVDSEDWLNTYAGQVAKDLEG